MPKQSLTALERPKKLTSLVAHVYAVYVKAKGTRERLEEAAKTILEAEGSAQISMRRVASEVGVTAMAVYRHFADRDALLSALADHGFADLSARLDTVRLQGGLEKRLTKVLDTNLDFALLYPRLFELMFLERRTNARQYPRDFRAGASPTANRFAELVQEGIRKKIFAAVDPWEIVFEIGALLQGLMMLYLGGRVSATEQQFRKMCHRAMERYLNGIRIQRT